MLFDLAILYTGEVIALVCISWTGEFHELARYTLEEWKSACKIYNISENPLEWLVIPENDMD